MKTVFLIILSSLQVAYVNASPLLWTFDGVGSGALNGAAFAGEPFTIRLTVDPTSVTNYPILPGNDVLWADVLQSTISVQNVGAGSFTLPLLVSDSHTYSALGFSVDNSAHGGLPGDMLDLSSPQFSTYGLTEPLGPLSFASPQFFNQVYGTTMGYLDFYSMSSISFSAEAIPEPSVLSVFSLAGAGFLTAYRCKRRPITRCLNDGPYARSVLSYGDRLRAGAP